MTGMTPFIYPSIPLLKLKTTLEHFSNIKEEELDAFKSPFLEIPSGTDNPIVDKFCNQRIIGGFQITASEEYCNKLLTPQIISRKRCEAFIGTYLGHGFASPAGLRINDYRQYKELKQRYFLRWLIEEKFFEGVRKNFYKKPTIICFGGRLSDPLMTPLASHFGLKKDMRIYAVKFNDAIYLWSEKHRKEQSTTSADKMAYYGRYFEHLLTKSHQTFSRGSLVTSSMINEFEKSFIIQEITFGHHQILCLNEIDAVSNDGEMVEIKLHGPFPSSIKRFGRYLQYWAQTVVSGVKLLVIGERERNGCLNNINIETTDSIGQKFGSRLANCYDFENQWLNFICEQFKENNPKVVKKFTWGFDSRQVISTDVQEELIPFYLLPPSYAAAVDEILCSSSKPIIATA